MFNPLIIGITAGWGGSPDTGPPPVCRSMLTAAADEVAIGSASLPTTGDCAFPTPFAPTIPEEETG